MSETELPASDDLGMLSQPEQSPPLPDEIPAPAAMVAVEAPVGKRKPRGLPRLRLDEVVVGTETQGKVMAVAKFGIFVDVGAVTDGLVHISEFPKQRVQKSETGYNLGDTVNVWIKDVDVDGNRISLSMRKRPERSMRELHSGDVLSGTVTNLTKYGAFVDIGAETEGLVHVSEMSSGYVEKPGEIVKAGQRVEVRIKDIDLRRERISLSMVGLANDLGLPGPKGNATPDDNREQSPERQPTVVELALRRALGELHGGDEAEGEPGTEAEVPPADAPARPDHESLGEVYERMLADYRASKSRT
jgi:predicted RNA-binding protein with RPS1 domain